MWDKISFGFDVEEETVNFGCRKMAICDSAVYETNTFAIISNEKKDEEVNSEKIPKVICTSYANYGIVAAINESIVIFNSSGNELLCNFSFNAKIDCYAVTSNESLIFIALNNGDLYCSSLNSIINRVYLRNLCKNTQNENTFVYIFVHEEGATCNVFLTAFNGNIYLINDLNLTELSKACTSQLEDDIIKITNNLNVNHYLSITDDKFKITASNELYLLNNLFILIVVQLNNSQELQLWSIKNELISSARLSNEYQLKKVQITKNGSLIYGLTTNGELLVICPHTLTTIFHQNNITILDFEIMDDEESNLLVHINSPSHYLQLISIPGFDVKFKLEINETTFLAKKQSSLDDLIYLEIQPKNNHLEDKLCSSIYLKIISESQPEYRLQRILRRGKFEEAEEFARNFKLDVELVYKSHLQKLLNDIQPWMEEKISLEESRTQFKSLLQKVQDIEFISKCALNTISSDFVFMKDVLKYAENRIRIHFSVSEPEKSVQIQELYNHITSVLLRISTFLAVCEKPLTVDKWLSFSKTNLIEECLFLLKQEKLNQVMLIWSRHIHEMTNYLTYEEALNFLRATQFSISTARVLDWLQILLSVCFSLFPKILKNVVSWCKEKINNMELFSESGWPDNGITFLNKVLRIIRENVNLCKVSSENVIQSEYAENSPLKDILFYLKILAEMSIMKKNYEINVTIQEYTELNKKEVIYTIIDKVPLEELATFVKGFLEKLILILEENSSSDSIISDYIQGIVERSVNWWYWDEPPWESRVCVLIDCIISVQEKLKCVLCVLNRAPVPWSSTISNMCEEALKYKNPLTKSINEQKKLVECKLILKKYDLKDTKLTKTHINRVLLYIFSQARNSMLEDALQIANTFDFEMCTEVYKLYVQHLIENKEFEKVLSFLDIDTLSSKVVIQCCEKIILRTHCLSELPSFCEKYQNYIEVLDSVGAKLSRAVSKLNAAGERTVTVVSPGICKQLKNSYYLKKNYNIKVSSRFSTKKREPGEREEVMQHCMKFILTNVVTNSKHIEKECYKFTELAKCFECDKKEIYINFINLAFHENKLNAAVYVSRLLLQENEFSNEVSKRLINTASTVFPYCTRRNAYSFNENDIAGVVLQLVVAGLNSCSSDLLTIGLEISNWCRLMQNPVRTNLTISDQRIHSSFSNNTNSNMIMKLLPAYGLYIDNLGIKPCIQYSSYHDSSRSVSPSNFYLLSDVLNNIFEQEQENVCFQIITTLHWSLLHYCFMRDYPFPENSLIIQTKAMSGQCILKLLKKLIGSRHLDCQFGLALLHYFSPEEATNWIVDTTKRFKYDFQRLNAITELGMLYFHENKLVDEWENIYKLRKQCVWGKQIMEYGLSYKEAFRETPYDQRQLLLKLIDVPSVNIDVLSKYCRDLKFSFQSCLKAYLKQTLITWEPEFEVKVNGLTGEKELIVKPTFKKLLQKCREIVALIENMKELSQIISVDLWDSVNYYHYEIFLILITLSEEAGVKSDLALFSIYRTVFLFLSSYQRISKPQEHEKDCWYQTNPNEQSLPPISEFRLPFRLLFSQWCKSKSDPWNIIKYELNFNVYTKWFAVLDALELDKNILCTLTINQVLGDKNFVEESNAEWCLYLRNQKLLSDVQLCVENINSLEMTSASLYYVINHLPPGADQVAAAKLCYLHAKQWRDVEKSDKAELGFLKVQKKFLTISTTHVLYIHNLGKQQYLQLVLKPDELINAIYNDSIILSKNYGGVILFPDINKTAEEISTLHRIDIRKIRTELLEEWLQPENFVNNVSYNETIQHNESVSENFTNVEMQNFQRACYVVEKYIDTFGPYLMGIAFDQNSDDSKPISVRLRALQCLFAVTTEDKLLQVTNQSTEELRSVLNTLSFVAELETLGLTYSVSAFKSCDKLEILKSLLSLKNPKAVRLTIALCQYYKIEISNVWNGILSKMCDYEMIKELSEMLPNLSNNYHMLDQSVFEKAWSMLLLIPLEKASCNPADDEIEMIERSINLINFCPIVDQINTDLIKSNCLRINRKDLVENIYLTF